MLRCIFLALSVVGVASSDAVAQKNLAAAQRDLALGGLDLELRVYNFRGEIQAIPKIPVPLNP